MLMILRSVSLQYQITYGTLCHNTTTAAAATNKNYNNILYLSVTFPNTIIKDFLHKIKMVDRHR